MKVTLFEGYEFDIIDFEGKKEIALLKDNKYVDDYKGVWGDVVRVNENDLNDEIEYYTSLILTERLNEEFDAERVETSILIETFSYKIWIEPDIDLKTGKVIYYLSTVNLVEDEKDHSDNPYYESEKNRIVRKTFKGLMNYINRFDK